MENARWHILLGILFLACNFIPWFKYDPPDLYPSSPILISPNQFTSLHLAVWGLGTYFLCWGITRLIKLEEVTNFGIPFLYSAGIAIYTGILIFSEKAFVDFYADQFNYRLWVRDYHETISVFSGMWFLWLLSCVTALYSFNGIITKYRK